MLARMEGEEGSKPEHNDVERLQRIASELECDAEPDILQIEKRAELRAATWIETCLNTEFEPPEENHLFLWLIYRALKGGAPATESMGAGLKALFKPKTTDKQPIDPDDKG